MSRKILTSDEARWMVSIHAGAGAVMLGAAVFSPMSNGESILALLLAVANGIMGLYWWTQV